MAKIAWNCIIYPLAPGWKKSLWELWPNLDLNLWWIGTFCLPVFVVFSCFYCPKSRQQELGRKMFNLEVSMVEQQSPRYFQRDLVNSGHRAASWCVSWKPVEGDTSSSSSSSRQAKMSFPELHFAMMDLGKFLNSRFFDAFSCCPAQQFQLRECISAAPSEAERKFAEVQGLSLDRQEKILLRATPASCLAAAWTDDHMKFLDLLSWCFVVYFPQLNLQIWINLGNL